MVISFKAEKIWPLCGRLSLNVSASNEGRDSLGRRTTPARTVLYDSYTIAVLITIIKCACFEWANTCVIVCLASCFYVGASATAAPAPRSGAPLRRTITASIVQ